MEASAVLYGDPGKAGSARAAIRSWARRCPVEYAEALRRKAAEVLEQVAEEIAQSERAAEYEASYEVGDGGSLSVSLQFFDGGRLDYGTTVEISPEELRASPFIEAITFSELG